MQSSTLLRRLNAGEAPGSEIVQELLKWNRVDGQVLAGLVRRREGVVGRDGGGGKVMGECVGVEM